MKWASRKRYPYVDYGAMVFVLSILIAAIAIVVWMLVLILFPRNATAGDVVNFRTATRQAPVTLHSDVPTTRRSVPVVTILCEISAYNPTVAQTDGNPLITASGQRVRVGGIAADLRIFPLGSRVTIPGYNDGKPCTVTDTGGAIRGNKLDVFMWRESEAVKWGRRRNVKVTVLYVPKATP